MKQLQSSVHRLLYSLMVQLWLEEKERGSWSTADLLNLINRNKLTWIMPWKNIRYSPSQRAQFGFHVCGFYSAVYHYQFRVQFVNQMEQIQPSLTISLTGTKEESGDIPISMWVEYSEYSQLGPQPPREGKGVRKRSWHTWKQLQPWHEREL